MKQMPFKPIVKKNYRQRTISKELSAKNYQQGTIGKELSAKIQLLVKRQDIIPEIFEKYVE